MAAIKKTTISRADAYKAGSWLETNGEKLKLLTREQGAKELGAHLGLPGLNSNHISRIVKDMGREWPGIIARPRAGGSQAGAHKSRFFARQILLLERQVKRLAKDLGVVFEQRLMLNIERLEEMSMSAHEPPEHPPTNGQPKLPL